MIHCNTEALPGPAGGIALPRPPSRYNGDGRKGRERVGNMKGRKGRGGKDVKGRDGWEGKWKDGKGKDNKGRKVAGS